METLKLTVTTPLQIILQEDAVISLRAEDASGDFGIRPGHTDFLTVIDAGVMRWRTAEAPWRYCALRGGIFSVTGGSEVRIACREAIVSEDLASLQRAIRWGDGDSLFELFSRTRKIRREIIEAGQDTASPDFGRGPKHEVKQES